MKVFDYRYLAEAIDLIVREASRHEIDEVTVRLSNNAPVDDVWIKCGFEIDKIEDPIGFYCNDSNDDPQIATRDELLTRLPEGIDPEDSEKYIQNDLLRSAYMLSTGWFLMFDAGSIELSCETDERINA